ncbi:phosphoadenosine phosphosulfate reductase family protein [Oceanisphaera sp. KMM 10153]|uniref:phosphoadenosine phosphosulfate reductase domain-containing protein n=1 Tax=Oceanisphaera submarina TaxID=3390193 RepID=UPI003975E755
MPESPVIHVSDISAKIKEVEQAFRRYLDEFGINEPVNIINNSGGKDSGATDLLAMAITGGAYRSVAADTGNEHPMTIEHLKTLHEQRPDKGPVVEIVSADYPEEMFAKRREAISKGWRKKQMVRAGSYRGILMPSLSRADTKFAENWRSAAKAMGWGDYDTPLDAALSALHRTGNPFLDMALTHGGFPLGRQRFCTDELKMKVVLDRVLTPLIEAGCDVVQWSGVRGDESDKRAGYTRFEEDRRDDSGQLYNFLPIHQWTAADVFALYRHFGVKPNPLYSQGMGRVGCMPCILVKKEELAEIAARFPSEIERAAEWELQVAKTSRWIHWMIVGHVNRRQFKPVQRQIRITPHLDEDSGEEVNTATDSRPARLGINTRLPHRDYELEVEAYQGTSMLGPRGGVIGGSVHDAVDWSKTGRGGKVYDLVTASINAESCSSKYGLCE